MSPHPHAYFETSREANAPSAAAGLSESRGSAAPLLIECASTKVAVRKLHPRATAVAIPHSLRIEAEAPAGAALSRSNKLRKADRARVSARLWTTRLR